MPFEFPRPTPRAILVLLLAILLGGCGFFGPKEDPTRDWSDRRLYDAARAALSSGNNEAAIEFYKNLGSRYPFGPIAEQGQIELAYTYYKDNQPELALATTDRFIKEHPRHRNLDYVYYLRGLVNYEGDRGLFDRFFTVDRSRRDNSLSRDAFRDFDQVVSRFPNSRYAEDSAQRMLFLREAIAGQEVHVANYYLRRRAFVAASNRARYVLENYQGTPAVPDALIVLAKAYRTLGLEDLYDDTMRILDANYVDVEPYGEQIRELHRFELQ